MRFYSYLLHKTGDPRYACVWRDERSVAIVTGVWPFIPTPDYFVPCGTAQSDGQDWHEAVVAWIQNHHDSTIDVLKPTTAEYKTFCIWDDQERRWDGYQKLVDGSWEELLHPDDESKTIDLTKYVIERAWLGEAIIADVWDNHPETKGQTIKSVISLLIEHVNDRFAVFYDVELDASSGGYGSSFGITEERFNSMGKDGIEPIDEALTVDAHPELVSFDGLPKDPMDEAMGWTPRIKRTAAGELVLNDTDLRDIEEDLPSPVKVTS